MSIIKLLKRRLLALVIAGFLLASLLSCDSSTSPQTGSLAGIVQLVNDTGDAANDPTDHSGVRIALYEPALLDTIVTYTRAAHPSVGFPIDQSSEFDHRLSACIAETNSDASGAFLLPKVPYGTYNLVIMKEGWGFRYVYYTEINSDNTTIPTSELSLYPERILSGYYSDSMVIDNWRHLVIIDDTVMSPESSLYIGSNAVVRINPTKKLDIMGSLETAASQGNMFRITSNDALFSTDLRVRNEVQGYHSLSLLPTATAMNATISWGSFVFGSIGLMSQINQDLQVRNCNFLSSDNGFWASNSASPSVFNAIFRSIGQDNTSVFAYAAGSGDVCRNVIIGGSTGVRCEAASNPSVTSNVIMNCESGIQLFDSDSIVRNNSIRGGNIGIRAAGSFAPVISFNTVSAQTSVIIGYSGYFAQSRAKINMNNLDASDYYYYVVRANAHDIDARNNYHYTTVQSDIESKTYHKPNYPVSQQNQVCYVIYNPFAYQPISNAGVQP